MLLRIQGDERLRNRAADEMNFIEGAPWSESGAGTNAIGTAVAAQYAVQVFAAEHFTERKELGLKNIHVHKGRLGRSADADHRGARG